MKSTAELAKGRWRELLPALGVDAEFLKNDHGPCPICGGKDRFRWDDQNSNGGFICSGCGAGDGFNLVQRVTGKEFPQIASEIDTIIGRKFDGPTGPKPQEDVEQTQRLNMRRKWLGASYPMESGPVWKYIWSRTGAYRPTDNLREHFAIRADGVLHPAMLAKIITHDDKAANLHITLLDLDGNKANVSPAKRVMAGKLPDGCAIRLGQAAPVMGVAEGIETAISASIMFEMPVWACINGTLLSKWIPPAIAEQIIVFGDNDRNFAGQSKAYALANRLEVIHKRRVLVETPILSGMDWNDFHKDQRENNGMPYLRVVK